MTSRTNRHLGGQHLGGTEDVTPSTLAQRRQLAVQRYLDGDLIETICHEMGCAKSWLYKWKNRSQATDPTWAQEHSRRPETTPTKTPEGIEAAIIQLRQTLSPDRRSRHGERSRDPGSSQPTPERIAPFVSHDLSHSQPSVSERGFTVRSRIGKLNGIFAPVSAGAHPRSPHRLDAAGG